MAISANLILPFLAAESGGSVKKSMVFVYSGLAGCVVGAYILGRITRLGILPMFYILAATGGVLGVAIQAVRRGLLAQTRPEDPPHPSGSPSETASTDMVGINAVFMGGGARGVVYAGAIRSVLRNGFFFRSAAGSSAGAIMAAFVAARLNPEQFEIAASQALTHATIRPFAGSCRISSKALYSVRRLGSYIEKLLRQQMEWLTGAPRNNNTAVTFRELFEASNVELNVVAMDLATKQPVVFNHVTSPYCQVTDAVLASCAIPTGMRSRRLAVLETGTTPRIHRLVDGGAWANFGSTS